MRWILRLIGSGLVWAFKYVMRIIFLLFGIAVLIAMIGRMGHDLLGGGLNGLGAFGDASEPQGAQVYQTPHTTFEKQDHIAVLRLSGIVGGEIDSDKVSTFLEDLKNAHQVKALVLYVDSPGGSAIAASNIAEALESLKEARKDLPVYAFTDGLMASGAYYISAPADRIISTSGAIVGSIGVYMERLKYKGLMDKLGLADETVREGKYKYDSPTVETSPDVARHAKHTIHTIYEQFVNIVLKHRKDRLDPSMPYEEVFSGGIWVGPEALLIGLVDEVALFPQVLKEVQTQVAKGQGGSATLEASPSTLSATATADASGSKGKGKAKGADIEVIQYEFPVPTHDGLFARVMDYFGFQSVRERLHSGLMAMDSSFREPASH